MHHGPPREHSGATPEQGQWHSLCLLGVPVDLFLKSQQHTDDLVRELWLVSESDADHGLRALERAADAYARRAHVVRNASLEAVADARERGDTMIDLRLRVPPGTAELTVQWAELLERLDELCRAGTLLTLPASEEVRRFRRWYAAETLRQLRDGHAPRGFHSDQDRQFA